MNGECVGQVGLAGRARVWQAVAWGAGLILVQCLQWVHQAWCTNISLGRNLLYPLLSCTNKSKNKFGRICTILYIGLSIYAIT